MSKDKLWILVGFFAFMFVAALCFGGCTYNNNENLLKTNRILLETNEKLEKENKRVEALRKSALAELKRVNRELEAIIAWKPKEAKVEPKEKEDYSLSMKFGKAGVIVFPPEGVIHSSFQNDFPKSSMVFQGEGQYQVMITSEEDVDVIVRKDDRFDEFTLKKEDKKVQFKITVEKHLVVTLKKRPL